MPNDSIRVFRAGFFVLIAYLGIGGCSDTLDAAEDQNQNGERARELGGAGESCTSRADCQAGLSCVRNVCSNSDAGVVLGGEGETCRARSDCQEGLSCFDSVCRRSPDASASEAGGPPLPTGPGGRQGESCVSSADCATPLVCVSGKCALGDFGIVPTQKECVIVQCGVAADCCPTPNALCEQWKQECEQDPDAGASSCLLYDSPVNNCVCDVATWKCEKHQCTARVPCTTELDCSVSYVCHQGECVNCVTADDCLTNQSCVDHRCTTRCTTNSQCPALHSCVNETCVETGCTDDRECVALERDALAICREGKCHKPCQRDVECSAPSPYQFRACVDGFCKDVGCQTDEECKIRLGTQIGTENEARCLEKQP